MRRQLAALEEALAASESRDRKARPASPISAAGSTSRSPSGCRNSRATARTSSGACARSSATGRTCASSATASCSSPRCSFPAGQAEPAAGGWRRDRPDRLARWSNSSKQIPPDIPWIMRVDGHTDAAADRDLPVPVELGACPPPAPSPWCRRCRPGRSAHSASPRPASASSSPSTSAPPTRPMRATGASS